MDRLFRDSELEFLNTHQPVDHLVVLTLKGSEGRTGWPEVSVTHNNAQIYSGSIEKTKTIAFDVSKKQKRNLICVELTNKQENDTVVDENNNITKDKWVVLESILLDKAYVNDPEKLGTTKGLYANSKMRFYYKNPPLDYLRTFKPKGYFETDSVQKDINENFGKTLELLQLHL